MYWAYVFSIQEITHNFKVLKTSLKKTILKNFILIYNIKFFSYSTRFLSIKS